jgi:hypothetical protein
MDTTNLYPFKYLIFFLCKDMLHDEFYMGDCTIVSMDVLFSIYPAPNKPAEVGLGHIAVPLETPVLCYLFLGFNAATIFGTIRSILLQ